LVYSNDLLVQISGNNKVAPVNGVYTFSNLTLFAKPMYKSTFVIASGAIDIKKR
jgi:hypothetical protein